MLLRRLGGVTWVTGVLADAEWLDAAGELELVHGRRIAVAFDRSLIRSAAARRTSLEPLATWRLSPASTCRRHALDDKVAVRKWNLDVCVLEAFFRLLEEVELHLLGDPRIGTPHL